MIVLATVVAAAVAIFGISASRLAVQDLVALESQQAAQRCAEAAVGRAGELVIVGEADSVIDAAAQNEAAAVADANLTRGERQSVTVVRTSSSTDLAIVTVTLVVRYGGFAGPLTLTATGSAAVPRPSPGP